MSIRLAELSDLKIIANITETTISEIYPHYYPKGAVVFFLIITGKKILSEILNTDRFIYV